LFDRAYSNFNNRIQDEGDTETTFEEIVYSEIEKIKNNENNNENNVFLVNEFYDLDLARGFYATQLKFWFKKFPRKNIFLTSSEELATNTDKTVSEILAKCKNYSSLKKSN
jgi:hypothetical protein